MGQGVLITSIHFPAEPAMTTIESCVPPSDPPPDFERYRQYLHVLAEMHLGAPLRTKVDASDLVQISLLEAHRDWHKAKFGSEGEFLAWLRTILAHNLANEARRYRSQGRDMTRERSIAAQAEQSSAQLVKMLASEQSTPSQQAVRNESADRLAAALGQLPPAQRKAVLLKHFQQRTVEQIAVELGRTEQAVGGLLKRGLQRLREIMAEADRSL
jgi:RNA polymerase sigma-70 factor, ECF subfamily